MKLCPVVKGSQYSPLGGREPDYKRYKIIIPCFEAWTVEM